MALCYRSRRTGRIYDADYIPLDDNCSFKNLGNFERLQNDPAYELVVSNRTLRNGYGVFQRRAD
jgi:hypothetical protein